MKVVVDGQDYEYDSSRLMLSEAFEIQNRTGLNLTRWQTGLKEMDAFSIKALVYLLKKRAGESPDWDSLDFDIGGLEITDDEQVEERPTPAEEG